MDQNSLDSLASEEPQSHQWNRTSPLVVPFFIGQRFKSIVGSAFSTFLNIAGPAAPVFVLLSDVGVSLMWRVVLAIAFTFVVQCFAAVAMYWFFKYRVDGSTVSVRSGVLDRHRTDVPWNQVRAVNVTRGPYDRLFRLGQVSFDTAGSQGAEIEIPGIKLSQIEQLVKRVNTNKFEDEIVRPTQSETTHDSEEVANEQPVSQGEILFELQLPQLLRATFCLGGEVKAVLKGALSFAGLYVLLRWGLHHFAGDKSGPLLDALFGWIGELPENFLVDVMRLPKLAESILAISILDSSVGLVAFFSLLAVFVSVLSLLMDRWRFIKKNFGLVLRHDDTHLVAESGLFSKTRVTVVKNRIQEISFECNLRERLLNRGKLTLQQSESDTEHELSIPYVDVHTVDCIARLTYGSDARDISLGPYSTRLLRVSAVDLYISLIGVVMLWTPVAIAAIATVIPYLRQFLWPYALVLPVYGIVHAYLSWRKEGYLLGDRFVIRRTGGLVAYKVRAVRLEKVQNVAITQALIQRIRARCNLKIQYVVDSIIIPYLDLASAKSMRSRVLHVVEKEKLKWI
ncbi:MAG: PH domain-containing protein [Gammaproteobacteria bacterium]|nr:PH domain-containing protein [Gammaproteobacteria bacterium]